MNLNLDLKSMLNKKNRRSFILLVSLILHSLLSFGQLENIERKDKVVIMIDSVGNVASKKELEDAINE